MSTAQQPTVLIIRADDGAAGTEARLRHLLKQRDVAVSTIADILPGAARISALSALVDRASYVFCIVSDEFLHTEGDHWRLTRLALQRMRGMPEGAVFVVPFWQGGDPDAYRDSELSHLAAANVDAQSWIGLIQ